MKPIILSSMPKSLPFPSPCFSSFFIYSLEHPSSEAANVQILTVMCWIVSPERYWSPKAQYLWLWPYLEIMSSQMMMMMGLLGWILIHWTAVLIKMRNLGSDISYRGNALWRHRENAVYKPKNSWDHQKLGDRPGMGSASQASEASNTDNTLIWIFSLQNSGTIHLCF